MQGTQVQSGVREDPTCRRAAKPTHHSYWSLHPRACALQEKPPQWEAQAPRLEHPLSPQLEKANRQNAEPEQPKNKHIIFRVNLNQQNLCTKTLRLIKKPLGKYRWCYQRLHHHKHKISVFSDLMTNWIPKKYSSLYPNQKKKLHNLKQGNKSLVNHRNSRHY